jgi:hypothetical protein
MNLRRFKAQKFAVRNGLLLGLLLIILNCILTFIPLDPSTHNALSYMTVPFIVFFAASTGSYRMRQTNDVGYAIQSSILTVSMGLFIGFSSLYSLTFTFLDTVRTNPVTIHNFALSGAKDLDTYIQNSLINAITRSVPVSIILGIITGAISAILTRNSLRKK